MYLVTAPEVYKPQGGEICVFLAGGITNCANWQKEVIQTLYKEVRGICKPDCLVVFNPRRENFPIHDPNAAQEQIEWEFKYLEMSDIFSMYFCSGISDQPICMYELGRHLHRISSKIGWSFADHAIITVEDGYKRYADVLIQSRLASQGGIAVATGDHASPTEHARRIIAAYDRLWVPD